MSIKLRTVLAILLVNLLIILFCVFAGIWYVGDGVTSAQEGSLAVTENIRTGFMVIGLAALVISIIASLIAARLINKPYEEIEALRDTAETNSMYKSTFLANMSHEMRTPMNAIIGMTSIGKSSDDLRRKDYAFEKIEGASTHLLSVINDVLDMSKIEANKLEISNVTFNFEEMVKRVVNVISFRIDERHQEFFVQIDKHIPQFVIGDDHRLTQVITNLLSNAVKFTPDNGSISFNAKHINESGGVHTIQIDVRDSGIGISKDQQQNLFNAFQQAESGISRKYGGTGLGLTISKRIVELIGGRIWVASELGKGATFSFTFQAEEGRGVNESMLAPDVNIKNIRILAIDDTPDVLVYFSDIMQRYGIKCDVAHGGNEAIEMIKKNGFYDLYFIDWMMPAMDGIELSRKIKKMILESESATERSTANRLPCKSVVIMISAAQWDNIEKNAKEAGVEKFLPKPLFPSAIINLINECLGGNSIKHIKEESSHIEIEDFSNHSLLLAEDIEINREIVLTLLEPTGLEIDFAETGKEAVDKYTAAPEKYDMILMDIHMPEMDGYEATRKIRALEEELHSPSRVSKHIPIIAMTANVFREDIEKCLEAGMDDHLGKPLDISDIMEKLKKYLHQRDANPDKPAAD